jgi:uncharacterized protein YjiS (DUF1127 family)
MEAIRIGRRLGSARLGRAGWRSARAAARHAARAAWRWLLQARERARQRGALLRLDDRMLKDIGISRCDAYRETRGRFERWWRG